jgi:hypothetical protein
MNLISFGDIPLAEEANGLKAGGLEAKWFGCRDSH